MALRETIAVIAGLLTSAAHAGDITVTMPNQGGKLEEVVVSIPADETENKSWDYRIPIYTGVTSDGRKIQATLLPNYNCATNEVEVRTQGAKRQYPQIVVTVGEKKGKCGY